MGKPPQPTAAPNDRTTILGVIGIVTALCCAPLGVLFGLLALMEARKHHTRPVLAYVAFWVAGLSLIGNIILLGTDNNPYADYWNR